MFFDSSRQLSHCKTKNQDWIYNVIFIFFCFFSMPNTTTE